MSTPAGRQREILDLLRQEALLTAGELVARLGVSPMTIRRDLAKLASAGLIVRRHGDVSLPAGANADKVDLSRDMSCAMCRRPVSERTAVVIQDGQSRRMGACCPHCALALLDKGPAPALALVTDFIYGHMIGAGDAAYLVGGSVTLCCSPSVLAFADADDARRFQRGFGGEVLTLREAQAHLRRHIGVSTND